MRQRGTFRSSIIAAVVSMSGLFVLVTPNAALAAACTPTTSFVGTDTVLKFTTVSTCTWNVPAGVTQVRALVVGGGGAGGKSTNVGGSGGGGAGAMVVHAAFPDHCLNRKA